MENTKITALLLHFWKKSIVNNPPKTPGFLSKNPPAPPPDRGRRGPGDPGFVITIHNVMTIIEVKWYTNFNVSQSQITPYPPDTLLLLLCTWNVYVCKRGKQVYVQRLAHINQGSLLQTILTVGNKWELFWKKKKIGCWTFGNRSKCN